MFLIDVRLKICDKALDRCPFVFDSFPDQYQTQEMCDKIISGYPQS